MAKIYYQLDRIESSVLPLFNRLESSLNQASSKVHQVVVPYDFAQRGIWSNMIDTIDQIKGNVITIGEPSTAIAIRPSISFAVTMSGFSEDPYCSNNEFGLLTMYSTR